MTTIFKKKENGLLRKALWQSSLVLLGVTTWVVLFRINDNLAFEEAWKSIISIQGLFVASLAITTGVISNLFIGNRYRVMDEVLISFILILVAGLIEAWGLGLRPAFLPALMILFYLTVKIWANYRQEKKFLKRTKR